MNANLKKLRIKNNIITYNMVWLNEKNKYQKEKTVNFIFNLIG